jgi:hypothetical protein
MIIAIYIFECLTLLIPVIFWQNLTPAIVIGAIASVPVTKLVLLVLSIVVLYMSRKKGKI